MTCIWSSCCHCHPSIPASVKIHNGLSFWRGLGYEKRTLMECCNWMARGKNSISQKKWFCVQLVFLAFFIVFRSFLWNKRTIMYHIFSPFDKITHITIRNTNKHELYTKHLLTFAVLTRGALQLLIWYRSNCQWWVCVCACVCTFFPRLPEVLVQLPSNFATLSRVADLCIHCVSIKNNPFDFWS